MNVELPKHAVFERKADQRGRISLPAAKYADENLEVAVLNTGSFDTKAVHLSEEERRIIVEHLLETAYSETESEEVEQLLDKLSPNWRNADSCREVQTNPVTVEQPEGENQ